MRPTTTKQAAIKLRSDGLTYGETRKVLKISKSTLSGWLKKIELSPSAAKLIANKQRAGLKALAQFNIDRTERIKQENRKITELYSEIVGQISKKELMLIGAALYWGEGYKNFGKPSTAHMCFANSDPGMIKVFMRFIIEILEVPANRVRAKVLLYPSFSASEAVDYWHLVSGIPKENFKSYSIVSSASKQIRPKNLLPYGTMQVLIGRRQEFFKIKGLIEGIVLSQ